MKQSNVMKKVAVAMLALCIAQPALSVTIDLKGEVSSSTTKSEDANGKKVKKTEVRDYYGYAIITFNDLIRAGITANLNSNEEQKLKEMFEEAWIEFDFSSRGNPLLKVFKVGKMDVNISRGTLAPIYENHLLYGNSERSNVMAATIMLSPKAIKNLADELSFSIHGVDEASDFKVGDQAAWTVGARKSLGTKLNLVLNAAYEKRYKDKRSVVTTTTIGTSSVSVTSVPEANKDDSQIVFGAEISGESWKAFTELVKSESASVTGGSTHVGVEYSSGNRIFAVGFDYAKKADGKGWGFGKDNKANEYTLYLNANIGEHIQISPFYTKKDSSVSQDDDIIGVNVKLTGETAVEFSNLKK